jgi:hypothetical protein
MDSTLTLAVRLLNDDGRREIARGVFRLGCRLAPAVASIPAATAEGSIATFMLALANYLKSGDSEPLVETVRSTASLRRLGGFDLPFLLVMSHAYLPVIRKVFLRQAQDVHSGLRAYDLVESAVLPVIATLLRELASETGPGHGFDEDEVDDSPFGRMPKTEEQPERPAFELISIEEEFR